MSTLSLPPPPSHHHWNGILDSAGSAVGNTPLINLSRLAEHQGVKCNILAKVEFFSAGGSIKDRIAKRMIESAERLNLLTPHYSTIIEPTSGNTGIGLALLSSLKGYRCIITLPAKMSKEKEAVLKSLGAEVVRTPTEAGWEDGESHIQIAKKLAKQIPGAVILDQYNNIQNPLAHYYGTFGEIHHSIQTSHYENKGIELLVAGAGTGGTITGLSTALRDREVGVYPREEREVEGLLMSRRRERERKEEEKMGMEVDGERGSSEGGGSDGVGQVDDVLDHKGDRGHVVDTTETTIFNPDPRRGIVVAVDPVGSILGGGESTSDYAVEGIGYDFFPAVLDPTEKTVDQWVKTTDEEAFAMVRVCMQTESLLIGGSSGSALAGLFKFLNDTEAGRRIRDQEGANVVVILPDGVRNYLSKSWYLDPILNAPTSELGANIERIIGRKMGDAYADKVEVEITENEANIFTLDGLKGKVG